MMFEFLKPKTVVRVVERVVPLVVEVDKPRDLKTFNDADVKESVVSLQSHPGFLYLLAKLRFQRNALESHLKRQKQETMQEVDFLKSGIAWAGWLEDQLNTAIKFRTVKPPQEAEAEEIELFNQLSKMLTQVGGNTPQE
jgi:hypothetical protein